MKLIKIEKDLKNKYKRKMEIINEQHSDDPEVAHLDADILICELLVELGYKDVVDEYDKTPKYYS